MSGPPIEHIPEDLKWPCTCLWSCRATSATIHNADPNCPIHGHGRHHTAPALLQACLAARVPEIVRAMEGET